MRRAAGDPVRATRRSRNDSARRCDGVKVRSRAGSEEDLCATRTAGRKNARQQAARQGSPGIHQHPAISGANDPFHHPGDFRASQHFRNLTAGIAGSKGSRMRNFILRKDGRPVNTWILRALPDGNEGGRTFLNVLEAQRRLRRLQGEPGQLVHSLPHRGHPQMGAGIRIALVCHEHE